jgi:hypothetical protein
VGEGDGEAGSILLEGAALGLTVTGISQSPDIKGLEKELQAAGFSLEAIQIVSPGDSDQNLVDVAGSVKIDVQLNIGGGQGTGVPGLTSGGSQLGVRGGSGSFFRNEELWDRLGDFEIPDDELENYVEAIEAGRSVVAYFAGKSENVPKLEELFRASGLAKVKTF